MGLVLEFSKQVHKHIYSYPKLNLELNPIVKMDQYFDFMIAASDWYVSVFNFYKAFFEDTKNFLKKE